MVSVIIAAHNEEAVIASCLDALLAERSGREIEIIVSANGCTDRTAEIAASRGVVVVDRPDPGKPGALNAADEIATGFPRVYLDADIVVPPGGLDAVLSRFDGLPAPLAVAPRRRIDTTGRPWPVRAYFAINERLPVFRNSLFGRGMIAVSEAGRRRFDAFPDLVADDLFLDAQFTEDEKSEVRDVRIFVEAPHTTRQLLRRLTRVRRGNAQMRDASDAGAVNASVRRSNKWSWFRDVVVPEPRLVFAAVPYVVITLSAGLLARRKPKADSWGRDESTRRSTRGEAS